MSFCGIKHKDAFENSATFHSVLNSCTLMDDKGDLLKMRSNSVKSRPIFFYVCENYIILKTTSDVKIVSCDKMRLKNPFSTGYLSLPYHP